MTVLDRPPVLKLDEFDDDIRCALQAFSADVTYAVNMARAAVTITRKRSAGQSRRKDKRAPSL